ncbi:MAG: formate dehydrogenase accessory sulfurtransferase FdhD, partial [Candidatus Eiseniibacteriota bacterium]
MSVPSDPPDSPIAMRPIARIGGGRSERAEDAVAVERVLEIRVDGRALAVTLCTPGNDEELALGFLAGEGLLTRRSDAASVRRTASDCGDRPDTIDITLGPGITFDWSRLERHFAATAACGLCGRAHLESLRAGLTPMPAGRPVEARALVALPEL